MPGIPITSSPTSEQNSEQFFGPKTRSIYKKHNLKLESGVGKRKRSTSISTIPEQAESISSVHSLDWDNLTNDPTFMISKSRNWSVLTEWSGMADDGQGEINAHRYTIERTRAIYEDDFDGIEVENLPPDI